MKIFAFTMLLISVFSVNTYAKSVDELIQSAKPLQSNISETLVRNTLTSDKNWYLAYREYSQNGTHYAIPVYMCGYQSYDVNKLNKRTDINIGKPLMETYLSESTVAYVPNITNPLTNNDICYYINQNLNVNTKVSDTSHTYRYKNKYFIEADTIIDGVICRVWLDNKGKILAYSASEDFPQKDEYIQPQQCIEKSASIVSKNNGFKLTAPALYSYNNHIIVRYYQRYNGMTCYDNFIEFEYDAYGNLIQFYNISEDLQFTPNTNLIDKSQAMSKIKTLPLVLDYYCMNNSSIVFQNTEIDKSNISLRYTYNKLYFIDARNGNIIEKPKIYG